MKGKIIQYVYLFLFLIIRCFISIDGFITDFVITHASIDDRSAIWDLCDKYKSIAVIGDKGYVNKRLTPELKYERDINLLFLKRGNSKENHPKEVR